MAVNSKVTNVLFQEEQTLLFSSGILKMGGEREPVPRGKKWPLGPFLAPDAQFIPGISIVDGPANLEHSDLHTVAVWLDVSNAVGSNEILQCTKWMCIQVHDNALTCLCNRMRYFKKKLSVTVKE